MVVSVSVKDIIEKKCSVLKGSWSGRNKKFKDWYKIIRLEDVLKQADMESVASNDPRTGYNLARHLLTTAIIAHKIPQDDLTQLEVAATSYMESYIAKMWVEHEARYRQLGKQGWLWYLNSWLMATGWAVVFSMVDKEKGIWSEVWNPAEVFPAFDESGMSEVVHIYTASASLINRKAKLLGWPQKSKVTKPGVISDYHGFDDNGSVTNAIMVGNELVKLPTIDPGLDKLKRLPVFIGIAGGLPDMGNLDDKWQEHYGESVIATNEDMSKNYNRMLTYTQQLVRDTANSRWFEQSTGDKPILEEENLYKRGAVFRGGPNDKITALGTPTLPVELRTIMFDYQGMLQRGLFSWITQGSVNQQMSYLAMASIASTSMQTLSPYLGAVSGLLADLDNYWTDMMLVADVKPANFKTPSDLPDTFRFGVQTDIEIPGYMVQKATVSRMLNPNFRLPVSWIMDRMFPEIRNNIAAQAGVRKEDAMMHPKAIMADAIIAYKEQARFLRESNDEEAAAVYDKLAASLEAELSPQQQVASASGASSVNIPPAAETTPRELGIPSIMQEEGLPNA